MSVWEMLITLRPLHFCSNSSADNAGKLRNSSATPEAVQILTPKSELTSARARSKILLSEKLNSSARCVIEQLSHSLRSFSIVVPQAPDRERLPILAADCGARCNE